MDRMPRPGEIYRDLDGRLYRVAMIVEHADTKEKLVIYQVLDGKMQVYALPVHDFAGEGSAAGRFELVPAVGVEGVAAVLGGSGERRERSLQGPTSDPEREAGTRMQKAQEPAEKEQEEFEPDPKLLAFLDAESYEKKLEVYASLAGKADEAMLNTIAVSLDLELSGDTLEERYVNLKNCLLMLEKYECNRLR